VQHDIVILCRSFSFLVDTLPPQVYFTDDISSFVASATPDVYFACSQSGCTFECKLEYESSYLTNGNRALNSSRRIFDFEPCSLTDQAFTLELRPSTVGIAADVLFLNELRESIRSNVNKLIDSACRAVDAEVQSHDSRLYLVLFLSSVSASVPFNLGLCVKPLFGMTLDAASKYVGAAEDEVDSFGQLCTCDTCATHATCTIETSTYPCPCVAQYPGSSLFDILAITYAPLQPERISLPTLIPELFDSSSIDLISYSNLRLTVRATNHGNVGPEASVLFAVGMSVHHVDTAFHATSLCSVARQFTANSAFRTTS
jgi:hypothetical protein